MAGHADSEVDLEAANARLANMNIGANDAVKSTPNPEPVMKLPANGAQERRTRKDKGVPRKVTEPSAPGSLTEKQWARLAVLVEETIRSACDLQQARQRHDRNTGEYRDYLDSLKA
jgi:hypothetical protein